MAGDRKIGDFAIAFAILIACFSCFTLLIMGFDSASHNSENIGSMMLSSSNLSDYVSNESYKDSTSKQLMSVTFDNNTFQAPTGQFIDTRGVSQANLIVNNYPSTISHFLSGISNLFAFKGSTIIFGMIIGIIAIIGVVLILRFFQGSIKI